MSYTKGKLHISKAYSKSVILDKGDIEVADCFGSTIGSANATAAELVKRWNCHEDLVKVCEGLMKKADNGSADFDDPEPGSIYLKAKAALAAAKE